MRGAIAAAAAAVIATGCFSVPAYQPEQAVSYTETGTGGTAAGPGFALHFAGGDGFHFPDALMVDGSDVMGHDATQECFNENELGVLISPTPRISATGGAARVTNHLVPALRGPAVVQLKLDWATQFACDPTRSPGGTATFTVFPDGRIVRHDTIVDASTAPISPGPCSCGDTNKLFFVSTFWTLARNSTYKLYTPNVPGPIDLPAAMDSVSSNYGTACVDGGGYQLAVSWSDFHGTTIRGGNTLVGFGRDLVIGDSNLTTLQLESGSMMLIEHAGCEAMATTARTDEYITPSSLSIGGAAVKPALRDGIYGGDSGDGQPGIPLTTDRVELTGPVKSSFAVWLRFPHAVDALRATLEGMKGPWYLPQQVDDHSWIIWFRDAISTGQKITIEAI
jgi:hypothetical protein